MGLRGLLADISICGDTGMIPIARPHIGDEEIQAVLQVLSSGQLAQGPKVREFEQQFADFCGAKYAVATSSGTTALHIAALAHGIGPGDEVITTPFSFVASANCVLYTGARPVFADIEPDFFTINPDAIKEKITSKTKAILPVHLYGQPCDMDAITEIAAQHNLLIIEDACQAHGAIYKGKPVGSFGTACYSFYPTKNMTTIEGGMLTTNDAQIAEQARLIRDHGSPQRYHHIMLGYNFRMTDLQAAIGLAQLGKLNAWNEKRRQNAAFLTGQLSQIDGIVTPNIREGATSVFHQYTIRIPNRDRAIRTLKEQEIGFGVHYPTPIYRQPYYQDLGYQDHLPEVERACAEVLSLPVHPSLSEEDLERIVAALREHGSGELSQPEVISAFVRNR
jgi:perosamine synthetase